MKLIFDCRFIRVDRHDGISRFSTELFGEISKLVSATALICDERQLELLPKGTKYIIANSPADGIREVLIARLLNKQGATHVFSPMQTMGSWGRKYKLILTLHDLIYYTHPTPPAELPIHIRIAWRVYHMNFWAVRLLLNRADAVVTVSETSKRLIQRNKLTNKPVHVVYNAPGSQKTQTPVAREKTATGRRHLVYMGSFMPYKNVECLIDAVMETAEFELLLLSKISTRRRDELARRAKHASQRIHFLNGVSDGEYAEILENAFALVSASKDEGFGIPLVEAMNRAIPIIVSDINIFREIAQSAGHYFDPLNPTELSAVIQNLSQPGAWETASELSLARSKAFNWSDSATELLAVLKTV